MSNKKEKRKTGNKNNKLQSTSFRKLVAMSKTPQRQMRFPLQSCLIRLRFSQDEGSRVICVTGTERCFGVPQPPLTRIHSLYLVKASQLFHLLGDWEGTSYLFLSTRLAAENQSGNMTGRAHITGTHCAGSQLGYMEARVAAAEPVSSGQSERPLWKARKEMHPTQPTARSHRTHPIMPH